MPKYIDKSALVAEIERRINEINLDTIEDWRYRLQWEHDIEVMKNILSFINTLEVKEVDLEKEIDNNNPKITIGTKIRSKANPYVILSIISDDCHEDKFECSNGTVLSLKQIEKYYDII